MRYTPAKKGLEEIRMGGAIRVLGWTVLAAGLAMLMAWWNLGLAAVIGLSGSGGNVLLLLLVVSALAGGIYIVLYPPRLIQPVPPQEGIGGRLRFRMIVIGLGIVGLGWIVASALAGVPLSHESAVALPFEVYGRSASPLIMTVFWIGIVVPLSEEALMRGWYMTKLREVLSPTAGISLSAVVFSATHQAYWSAPMWLLAPLVMGLVCGWAVYLSGSLLEAWVIHGLWNLTAIGASPYLILLASAPLEMRLISGLVAGLGSLYLTHAIVRQVASMRPVRMSTMGANEADRAGV